MKKILVTGSNGLLGQKLIDLLRKNSEVTLIATAKGINRNLVKDGYIYESLDITSESDIERVMNIYHPNALINTAAMTMVDDCEFDHINCDLLNVTAVELLAKACTKYDCRMVHVSSDFIFAGTHGPITEEEIPAPLSYYGNSKLLGEQAVIIHAKKWSILRTVLVYGIVNDMSRSNIILWAKGSLEQGKTIQVVDDQFRTPTLAEDLAQGCMLAATKEAKGIYNISGKDFMSIYDLVQRVAEFWNLDKSLIKRSKSATLNQAAKRPPITGFILDKAIRDLGYHPHSFEEGLALFEEQLKGK